MIDHIEKQHKQNARHQEAGDAYFRQLKEEGIPAVVAGSTLMATISQPGEYTAENIYGRLKSLNLGRTPSKLLIAKFLEYQHELGNLMKTKDGRYIQMYQQGWAGCY